MSASVERDEPTADDLDGLDWNDDTTSRTEKTGTSSTSSLNRTLSQMSVLKTKTSNVPGPVGLLPILVKRNDGVSLANRRFSRLENGRRFEKSEKTTKSLETR